MKIFLTDYASYHNGTQFEFGHWVDLTDFNDPDELMEYIENHFAEADERSPLDSPREEIMVTDIEGIPEALYSESMGEAEFNLIYQVLEIIGDYNLNDESDLLALYNEYCDSNDIIYINDEDFLNHNFDSIADAVRATSFGDYRYNDDWARFDGYANLESTDHLFMWVTKSEVIDLIANTL